MINKKKTEEKEVKFSVNVTRAKQMEKSGDIAFDMVVNGVNLYGLMYKQGEKNGKEYAFVAFPSHKGKDDKYYNYCYFKIDDSLLADIEKQIENLL